MREPEGVPVVRWRCVNYGCRKSYADRHRARSHAAECPRDPDNRSCLTCANFDEGYDAGWDEGPGEPPSCVKGLSVGGRGTGEPMPRGCPVWDLSDSQRKYNPVLVDLGEKP